MSGFGSGVSLIPARSSGGAIWTPASLIYSPTLLFDTAVTASITKDGSNNVTSLADARANYQVGSSPAGRVLSGVGSDLVAPVLHADVTVDGRPGLKFAHSLSTYMRAPGAGIAPGNAPFALFSIATMPAQTLTDYAAIMYFGATGPVGPPYPGNVVVATMADGSFFGGGYGSGGGRGYGAALGRDQSQPTTAAARFVISDGNTVRGFVNGVQEFEWVGTSYGITDDAMNLGGTFGLGQGPDHYQHYGFLQWSTQGTLSPAEVMNLNAWVAVGFPSMRLPPRIVVKGCSLEAGANSGASPQINGSYISLAAAAARASWDNHNASLFGRGIGLVSNGNGTALFGDGSQTVANPDLQSTFRTKDAWQFTLQGKSLGGVGTCATNDMYFGATAAQAFGYQRDICSLVAQRGGISYVCTIAPRTDSGVNAGFAAQHLIYNAMVRALWNVPLESGGLGATFLLDVESDPRMQTTTNAAVFNGDQVHWLARLDGGGQAIVAGVSTTGAPGCPAYGPGGSLGNVGFLGILNAAA